MDKDPTETHAEPGDLCAQCSKALKPGALCLTDGYDLITCSPECYAAAYAYWLDNYDPPDGWWDRGGESAGDRHVREWSEKRRLS